MVRKQDVHIKNKISGQFENYILQYYNTTILYLQNHTSYNYTRTDATGKDKSCNKQYQLTNSQHKHMNTYISTEGAHICGYANSIIKTYNWLEIYCMSCI